MRDKELRELLGVEDKCHVKTALNKTGYDRFMFGFKSRNLFSNIFVTKETFYDAIAHIYELETKLDVLLKHINLTITKEEVVGPIYKIKEVDNV